MAQLRLGRGGGEWARSGFPERPPGGSALAAGTPQLPVGPHHQRQGRFIHGAFRALALPHCPRPGARARAGGIGGGSMRDAFIRALAEMAEADRRVLLVTGDLGFGVFDQYRRRFPGQFLNAGVAEQNMTMVATGLALEGRVVFTYSIANFPTLRCLEQIRSDAAYHQANLKVVAIGGGFSYGALGISHHATEDLAILRALPGITVLAPGDLWEAEQATRVLAATPGTAYLRLDKSHARTGPGPGEA